MSSISVGLWKLSIDQIALLMINPYGALVELGLAASIEIREDKAPSPNCIPQIQRGSDWDLSYGTAAVGITKCMQFTTLTIPVQCASRLNNFWEDYTIWNKYGKTYANKEAKIEINKKMNYTEGKKKLSKKEK